MLTYSDKNRAQKNNVGTQLDSIAQERFMHRRVFLKSTATMGLATAVHAEKRPDCLNVAPKLRIEKVDVHLVKGARGLKWILLQVRTNEGITGVGECWPWFNRDVMSSVRAICQLVVGRNPLDINPFFDEFKKKQSGLSWFTAISGLEIAMWDVAGQVAGLPIYQMLGGALRRRIPLYANHGTFLPGAKSLEDRVVRAVEAKEAGFEAFKWDPTTPYGPRGEKNIGQIVEEIAVFRRAVGDDFQLAIDAHNNLSVSGALELAPQLNSFNLFFFEAPLLWPNNEAGKNLPKQLRRIATATQVPLAIGEWLYDEQDTKSLIRQSGIRLLQPEISQIGGIGPMFRVAHWADGQQVQIGPHHWTGPILALAAAHVSATIPNLMRQEYAAAVTKYPAELELIDPPITIDQGHLVLPNGPGLGASLNTDSLASLEVK